ncbi:class I SAM-dependent methyltransferase [Actinacidiphila acidipaludis]|uniref:Class I SAM-dependent methyltransferase n=1 Tax=Actinacidiphila acidipaludis TaxID=2873382 RepID=A0ABS7Q5X0_9ACTN|nr:class I SAM-dependent methyltransferase [Streptomyces acidipaludis]MBY8878134.1 class I SAM-dependent methyltransferase [Streptomyces acidipaludis]
MDEFDAFEREIWAGRAEAYARTFGLLCARTVPALLDAAGLPDDGSAKGLRLLDAGTGPGTVAAAAWARGAVVTAIDAEPSMVERAAEAVPEADVRLAVLPELPFEDRAFDVAVANFAVNHVARPRKAVAELRRVVRPGGRIAVTVWAYPPAPGQALLGRAAAEAGASRPDDIPQGLAADQDFPRTAEGLSALLAEAGLTDALCTPLHWDHVVDPEVWWAGATAGIGSIAQTVSRQTPETVARIRGAYDELCGGFRRPDGLLALPHRALLAQGGV